MVWWVSDLHGLAWLIPDQVLVTAELHSALRVINLIDEEITSLCRSKWNRYISLVDSGHTVCYSWCFVEKKGSPDIFILGDESSCEVYVPGPVFTIRDTLYVGTLNGTGDDSQAYFLRLNFSKCYYGHVLVHYLPGYMDQRGDNDLQFLLQLIFRLLTSIDLVSQPLGLDGLGRF